jgi:pSer/pThr/pTyr-binding forkhead associated (FHA) protein
MRLLLTVLAPEKLRGKEIPVGLSTFLIGREPGCHLRPTSPLVSKRHCALLVREGKVFLRDFDSTNGTFLNDRQVNGEIELLDGDRLRAGPLTFAVGIEAGVPIGKATPPPPTKAPPRSAEEEVAALLLAADDGGPPPGSPGVDGAGVPTGSTEMEMPSPEPGRREAPAPDRPMAGDSSSAARAILAQYLKRPCT